MRAASPAIQLLPLVAALSLAFASPSTFAANGASGQDDLTAGDEKVMQAVQVTGARARAGADHHRGGQFSRFQHHG
ncbi:hypothetical protein, partial [Mesorhizobium japonicum]|uniref:hypothetical protein n=1 Tax=Mesorhizobium japonicum TaxID=2066070 RepID=UPI003B5C472F